MNFYYDRGTEPRHLIRVNYVLAVAVAPMNRVYHSKNILVYASQRGHTMNSNNKKRTWI